VFIACILAAHTEPPHPANGDSQVC